MSPPFATPSPKHERVPKSKRYCTNCRRDVEVTLTDPPEAYCPVCHERTLLPRPEAQRHDRKGL